MGIKVKGYGFTSGKFGTYGQKRKVTMFKNGDVFEVNSMDDVNKKHMIVLDENKESARRIVRGKQEVEAEDKL